ncbi:putative ricin B-like lectin [Helianthus debilis subsp. tardiflorus]
MRSVVQLTEYNPDKLDESVLWTESKDLGDGYRAVRMVNNIRLNVDAFNGDKNHGGVRDGTKIVLWEWKKDGNQRWNMVPYCKYLNSKLIAFLNNLHFTFCLTWHMVHR